jgi:hypothetical protein
MQYAARADWAKRKCKGFRQWRAPPFAPRGWVGLFSMDSSRRRKGECRGSNKSIFMMPFENTYAIFIN